MTAIDSIEKVLGYVICNESGTEYESSIGVNVAPINYLKDISDKLED